MAPPSSAVAGRLLSALALACSAGVVADNATAADPRIAWAGRTVANADGSVSMEWEGVSARFLLNGSGTTAVCVTIDEGNAQGQRWALYADFLSDVPNHSLRVFKYGSFTTAPGLNTYVIAGGHDIASGAVILSMQREIEPVFAGAAACCVTRVLGFEVEGQTISAAPRPQQRIEFIGDSITAGMGALGAGWDGTDPCEPSSMLNSYSSSYANLLCQQFAAECSTLAWSGIALYDGYGGNTMPMLYDYTMPASQTLPWNFSSWVPHAVFINLGTNDWCCSHGGNATFAALFAENYVNFVMHISQKYADEQARAITYFLAYGPMQTDNDYVAAIDYVYTNLTLQSYKVAVVNLTMANYAPVGCQWHPSAYVHNQMALQAQGQMWRVMNWTCPNCW